MRPLRSLLLISAMLAPSVATAAPEARALPSEIRLSEADKEKVLEAAAARKRQPAHAVSEAPAAEAPGRQVHGEVGFSIGIGGYKSGYGTAFVPLGEEGLAIISLGSTDFGSRGSYFGPEWR